MLRVPRRRSAQSARGAELPSTVYRMFRIAASARSRAGSDRVPRGTSIENRHRRGGHQDGARSSSAPRQDRAPHDPQGIRRTRTAQQRVPRRRSWCSSSSVARRRSPYGALKLLLPWLAMEYVHGETLEVNPSHAAQEPFGVRPERVPGGGSHRVGLDAVHSVDVLHRDIKPNNVLCCGRPPEEAFKISSSSRAPSVSARPSCRVRWEPPAMPLPSRS